MVSNGFNSAKRVDGTDCNSQPICFLHAVHRKQGKSPPTTTASKPKPTKTITSAAAAAAAATTDIGIARRGLILSAVASAPQLNDSRTELLKKYLKKSEENKAKNDKERMENYYKRNYKDYFEFVEGTLRGKNEQQLTEAEKGILDWLKANK